MVVGITGRIGSGKTEVARIFQKNGFELVDVDIIGHDLLKRDDIKSRIRERFGNKSFIEHEIDRHILGEIVLASKETITAYNSIVHPHIIRKLKVLINNREKTSHLVIDCALIFEWSIERLFDYIVLVKCSRERCLERAVKAGKREDFVRKILSLQMPDDVKLSKADFVIENTGDLSELEEKSSTVIKSINMLKN